MTSENPVTSEESLTETSKEETSVASSKSSENVAPPENKGKLRLALSYDSDSLIVSILEACDVHVPSSDTSSNPYVKISLIPSGEGGVPLVEHQTKVATNTKEPAFRETFLVKIEEGDSSQRLLVSLWNQGDVEDYSCGGMSFSIDEYAKPNTSVNGWYYLLDDLEAERSNIRCVQPVKNHVVSTNKISLAADKRPVKIQRNAKGLGFAVVSDGPVIVTSVENGGPAAAGGLLKGDMILAVNGKEVSDLSCAYVSKLLRQCGDSVEMVVQQAPRDMLSNPCYTPDLMNGAKDKDHTSLPPVVLDWETLPPLEQKRQQAIQDLIRSEDHYLTDLKFGIERYLLPLKKKDFIAPEKHEKMFNNIKEVSDITNKVLKSLTISRVPLINTSPNLPYYIYSIGEVYRENSAELIQQYEEYLNGRKAAHQEFNRLHNVGEFMTFLQEPPALPDLCNILQQPREHIGSLPCLLQSVLSATPLHHPDQAHLGHVIQVLSALSRTSPSKKKSEARKMADIQERLIFSSSVKPFPIKEGDRVLVHEGSLYKLDKKKKHKVYAMLFTDLLLLTKEVGQHLKVVQDPMFLSQIMIQDFNCDDGTEFHITVVATLPAEGDKVIHGDTYVLRGKTADSKEIWKKVIGDRASGVDRLTQKPKDPNIYNLPCLPTPIPDPDHSTSEPEVDDMGVPIWDGVSKGNAAKNDKKPGKKGSEDCKSQPNVEQCRRWQESLENVLHDPKGEAHFLRFLKKEFCSENFEFWKDVKQLKKKKPEGEKLKKDVKIIYDEYIGDSASKQINVNGKLKVAIRDTIDEPYIEMFDDAQKFVIQLMRDGPYRRFIDEDNLQEILKGHG
ncbi:uncharacterized protein LOC134821461 isoform X7 [Bolinopsis microptera]|uniref:uncharacterized protein LOC134821461 isoform X7 n=1 Tax=Bolinopsis microptera TaxID=2820187 RepID=UPI003078AC9F